MSGDAPASHKPGGGHEEEHEEHVNHEAWVIPYADMLTLLMALFLMLWATSSVDEKKFSALAESLRDAFSSGTGEQQQSVQSGSPGFMAGQQSGVEGGDRDQVPFNANLESVLRAELGQEVDPSASAAEQALQREQQKAEEQEVAQATLSGVQLRITEAAQQEGVLESLQFRREERGLIVTVVTDDVLFDSGSADLRPQGGRILTVVGQALAGVPNYVMVEGHTDNTPVATAQYPSNWELSSRRGTSVLRFLTERVSFPEGRIASAGYADTKPATSNDTASGKAANRRVEIVVLNAS